MKKLGKSLIVVSLMLNVCSGSLYASNPLRIAGYATTGVVAALGLWKLGQNGIVMNQFDAALKATGIQEASAEILALQKTYETIQSSRDQTGLRKSYDQLNQLENKLKSTVAVGPYTESLIRECACAYTRHFDAKLALSNYIKTLPVDRAKRAQQTINNATYRDLCNSSARTLGAYKTELKLLLDTLSDNKAADCVAADQSNVAVIWSALAGTVASVLGYFAYKRFAPKA